MRDVTRQGPAAKLQMPLGASLHKPKLPKALVKKLEKYLEESLSQVVCNAFEALSNQYPEEALDLVKRITAEPLMVHAQNLTSGTAVTRGDRGWVKDAEAVRANDSEKCLAAMLVGARCVTHEGAAPLPPLCCLPEGDSGGVHTLCAEIR